MKTYLLNPYTADMLCFEDIDKTVSYVKEYGDHVRKAIPIMEDGALKVSEEDVRNVSKGDIVVLFWGNHDYIKNSVIVIKSPEWFENLLAKIEFENKRSERNILLDECVSEYYDSTNS